MSSQRLEKTMSEKPKTLLVVTNVWVDYYLGSRAGSKAAAELFAYTQEASITLAYPAQSIKDVFYIIHQQLKRELKDANGDTLSQEQSLSCAETAWACVLHMAEMGVAAPLGEAQIWLASHYRDIHEDFEDCLILATAKTTDANLLVTNDADLLRKAPLAALSTKDALAYLRA